MYEPKMCLKSSQFEKKKKGEEKGEERESYLQLVVIVIVVGATLNCRRKKHSISSSIHSIYLYSVFLWIQPVLLSILN